MLLGAYKFDCYEIWYKTHVTRYDITIFKQNMQYFYTFLGLVFSAHS